MNKENVHAYQKHTLNTKPYIGRRILAGFIDYAIIYTFFFVFLFYFGEVTDTGSYEVNGWPSLIPMLFWGVITVGMERVLGVTLGNAAVGLKAIPACGTLRKLSFSESLKRHLLDAFDMLFFGLVGIITIKYTDKNQRLGDLWAKTIVVKL